LTTLPQAVSVPDTQTKVHLALAARAQQATVPMMDLSAQGHGQTARLRNSHCAATATTGERATLNCRVPASAKPIMVTVPMNMQIAMNFAAPHARASMNASGAVSDNRQQPEYFG